MTGAALLNSEVKRPSFGATCSSANNSTKICVSGDPMWTCDREIAWTYLKGVSVYSTAERGNVTRRGGGWSLEPISQGSGRKLPGRGEALFSLRCCVCSEGFLFSHSKSILMSPTSALTSPTGMLGQNGAALQCL